MQPVREAVENEVSKKTVREKLTDVFMHGGATAMHFVAEELRPYATTLQVKLPAELRHLS